MRSEECIKKRVHSFYWDKEINCATTCLKILAEEYSITIADQVIDSAVGMHGAGGYRAQCGLIEGTLMFIGILGRSHGFDDDKIISVCRSYAKSFEKEFGSLSCRVLRPEGFSENLPPHLCEGLSSKAVIFNIKEIGKGFDL